MVMTSPSASCICVADWLADLPPHFSYSAASALSRQTSALIRQAKFNAQIAGNSPRQLHLNSRKASILLLTVLLTNISILIICLPTRTCADLLVQALSKSST